MKTRTFLSLIALLSLLNGVTQAAPLGTAFTYQGRLKSSGQAANGLYDLRFAVYDAPAGGTLVAGPLTNSATTLTNGYFTVALDFGAVFTGNAAWLEIAVRTNGSAGAFGSPTARQALTPTPHALYARRAGAAATAAVAASATSVAPGSVSNAALQTNAVTTDTVADGTLLPADLDPNAFDATFWKVRGNAGTKAGAHFLGTTDNQPLEFKVNNQRVLRLELTNSADFFGAPNVIGGAPTNSVTAGVVGATIAGGGAVTYYNEEAAHTISADFGTIGGGYLNTIEGDAWSATIAGGDYNRIGESAWGATIGGGDENTINPSASESTIGGGFSNHADAQLATIGGGQNNIARAYGATIGGGGSNIAQPGTGYSVIGGGNANVVLAGAFLGTVGGGGGNRIQSNAPSATVGGGYQNIVQDGASYGAIGGGANNTNTGTYATVPGGLQNAATNYAFAAGRRAKANHAGSFVWADYTDADFASTTNNQFNVRARGGIRLDTAGAGMLLDGNAVLAGSVGPGQLSGTYTNALYFNNWNNTFLGWFIGNGGFLTNLNAYYLSAGTVSEARIDSAIARDAEVFPLVLSQDGSGSGLDADLLDGQHATAFAGAAHTHDAAGIVSGTLADARLGGNVARLNTNQTFVSSNTFNGVLTATNTANTLAGTFTGSGAGLTGISIAGLMAGTSTQAVVFSNPANSFSGSGAGLTSLNAGQLTAGTVPDARLSGNMARTNQVWLLGGNSNTTPATHFLGTTDNQPLEIKVNNQRALRLEWVTNDWGGAANVVGGVWMNDVADGIVGATIAGGGVLSETEGNWTNSIASHFATIGGGDANTVEANAAAATIAGGEANGIGRFSLFSTIGGGCSNTIQTNSAGSTIGGGTGNTCTGEAGTVPGGSSNCATNYSLAAGRRAKANHTGSFVWADSTEADFATTGENQFLIRASGGVGIGTVSPKGRLEVTGTPRLDNTDGPQLRLTGSGGSGALSLLDLATYPPGTNAPSARIQALDDFAWSSSVDILTKQPGASENLLVSRLHIAAAGNVGIGKNNPATALDVNGTVTATAFSGSGAGLTSLNAGQLSGTVNSAQLAGTYSSPLVFNNPANQFSGNGANLTGLSAWNLSSGTLSDARLSANVARLDSSAAFAGDLAASRLKIGNGHELAGNLASIAGGQNNTNRADSSSIGGGYANTIEPWAYESVIGGGLDNTIEPNTPKSTIDGGYFNRIRTGSIESVIGGGSGNTIETNANGSIIAGGSSNLIRPNAIGSSVGGGVNNRIGTSSTYGVIGGGAGNEIAAGSPRSTIAGGDGNGIADNTPYASVLGGIANDIGTNCYASTIGGGYNNNIADNSGYALLAGGYLNNIGTNASYGALGGGYSNRIADFAPFATIPGGRANNAAGYAFAAGYSAKATNQGAFVWSDGTGTTTGSTNNNSVTFRASGGYRLFTSTGVAGAYLAPNSGGWIAMSDRNAKEALSPVNARAVLDKVAALPIGTWRYKGQDASVRHIGPVAQDFKAAFQVGETETGINTVDADGVALAAIQGLNQKLTDELRRRDAENVELKKRLERLEQLLAARNGGGQ